MIVLADTSTHFLTYEISAVMFNRLGDRSDEKPVVLP
jgi:hypothetical protein